MWPTSIITGGGRGIGREIAICLSWISNVVLVGRSEEDLVYTCKHIEGIRAPGTASYVVGMVSDSISDTAGRAVAAAPGRIANLICNAGVGKRSPTEILQLDQWKAVMDTNVTGSFLFVKACLPAMLEAKRGNIVLMSSTAGLKGVSHDAAYCTSKHALIGLARALAKEYGSRGIVSIPLCPGFVDSDRTDRAMAGYAARHHVGPDEAKRAIEKVSPQNRLMKASEVANVVRLICEGQLNAMSGSPLILSGGEL